MCLSLGMILRIMNKENLILIIARGGGTKNVSKQNLRLVNGKPLLYYVLKTAKSCKNCHTVVSTDSDEIMTYVKFFGGSVIKRAKTLAKDETSLEKIGIDTLNQLKNNKNNFKKCLIIHPHFPLIKSNTIQKFFKSINNNTKVVFGYEFDKYTKENFGKLQQKNKIFQESKDIVKLKKIVSFDCKQLLKNKKFNQQISGIPLTQDEIFSPNNYHDFATLENVLNRKKIIVRVDGDINIGLGHVYNMLTILNNIRNEDILVVMNKKKNLGKQKFLEHLYNVKFFSTNKEFWKIIKNFKPNIIFNDILNTERNYVEKLKKLNLFVVNFEDLGEGRKYADLVFNPIFENKNILNHEYYGSEYACVRDEFRVFSRIKQKKKFSKIAITLGGVDKKNNSLRILSIIKKFELLKNIKIEIILGLGFKHKEKIQKFTREMNNQGYNIHILEKVELLSKHMIDCDYVITSNGRTVFEVASLGIPLISLSVNKRERQHNFVENKKIGYHIDFTQIKSGLMLRKCIKQMSQIKNREKFISNLEKQNLRKGIDKVTSIILTKYESEKLFM